MKKAQLLTWLVAFTFALGQEKPDLKVDPIPQSDYYKMAMTASVVDEDDKPIEGAEVNFGFPHGMFGDKYNNYIGKSDENGNYHAESLTCSSYIEIIAEKEGYYKSRLTYEYGAVNTRTPEELKKSGRFEPWNPTVKIMLKKIGKPIPMLVRLNDSITVPTSGEIPFDLMVWDWLAPHGKGKVADVLFSSELHKWEPKPKRNSGGFINESDKEPRIYATMKMRFVGEHDGMCPVQQLIGTESDLHTPRTAPEDGYVREYRFAEPKPDEDSYNAVAMLPKAYLLRIRTKVDADGKILSAQYGKIVRIDLRPEGPAPISIWARFGGSDKPVISFASCYLNPTPNDRNVEYDGEHNLAPEIEDGYHWAP